MFPGFLPVSREEMYERGWYYYDYLLDAPEADLKESIGEIERRLSESVREFDEIRGRSERAS